MANTVATITQKVVSTLTTHTITVAVVSGGITIIEGGASASPVNVTFTSSDAWHVLHNKGKKPIVDILDQFGNRIFADVSHVSDNEFYVYFVTPTAGSLSYF